MRGVRAYAVGHRHPGRRRPRRGRRAGGRHRATSSGSCLAKGVTALVVLSAGFADAGPDGRDAPSGGSSTTARAHGMRVVGPERARAWPTPTRRCGSTPRSPRRCPRPAGSASSASPARWASRCSPRPPSAGWACRRSSRPATAPTCRGNDLLQYWQTDPATDVVLLYLETFGNPRKFARLARRLAPHQADRRGEERAAHGPVRRARPRTSAPVDERRRAGAVRAVRA